jgi:hypothetical protein
VEELMMDIFGREPVLWLGFQFYGIASNGKVKYAEQLITFPDGRMTATWTGVAYPTVKAAQEAIKAKNLAISVARGDNGSPR